MTFWFSPFPLSAALEAHLRAAGMQPHLGSPSSLPAGTLILYPAPHALAGLDGAAADPQAWLAAYAQVIQLASQHRSVAIERLQALATEGISTWLNDGSVNTTPDLPSMEPLQALITRELLHAYPQLLEAYLDLELQAELLGGAADSHYMDRLRAAGSVEALLKAEGSERQRLAEQVKDAQDEADFALAEMHQVQEELEQVFLASQEQQKEVAASRDELTKANQACEQLRAELKAGRSEQQKLAEQAMTAQGKVELTLVQLKQAQEELAKNRNELTKANQACEQLRAELKAGRSERQKLADQAQTAQEQAELTQVQLKQVQKDLEHYFLLSRDQQTMIERQNKLSTDALALATAAH